MVSDSKESMDKHGIAVGDPEFVPLSVNGECGMVSFVWVVLGIAAIDPMLVHIVMDSGIVAVQFVCNFAE